MSDYFTNVTSNATRRMSDQMNDRNPPPATAPTLVLEPPELSPPLEVEEGTADFSIPVGVSVMTVNETVVGGLEEDVLEREIIDGAEGVASGSLPAAFARTGSKALSYTRSIKHMGNRLVECAYSIIHERPVWDGSIERNVKGVPEGGGKPQNWDKLVHELTGPRRIHCHSTVTRTPNYFNHPADG